MFVLAKPSELHDDSKAVRPSSLKLYNHESCSWVKCSDKLWARLAKWAREHATVRSEKADDTEDIKNDEYCKPFVFDAHKAYECRGKLKDEKDGVAMQTIILISLVVS